MTMQSESSTSPTIAAYAFAIATALQQEGVDPVPLFKQCELPLPTTTDPLVRLSNEEVSRLFAAAVEATGDPCFGLTVAEAFHPGNLHALGYALMASHSLRDFCERLSNFYRVVSQNAMIRVEESEDEFLLVTEVTGANICPETHDAFTALMVRFMRFIYNPMFNPVRVALARPDPGDDYRGRYRDYFRCDISFDNDRVVIAINPAVVDVSLPGASKELAQMHDQTVMQYLKQLERSDIVNRVRGIIVEELSSCNLNKQRVADKMHMSARSLQMKLAAKDTSFQEILDSTRHSLALGYMEQSAISITEAAYLLGFSEVSNFTRAFKRWTGKSPRDFRQSLGLGH
jgi:AraC-like DNA-binding protein